MKPQRIQLHRAKGFRLQEASQRANGLPAVNVARPRKFGNPFTITQCRSAGYSGTDAEIAERCVEAFRAWLGKWWRENWDGEESQTKRQAILDSLPGLRGKNLACWCRGGQKCHADVLLELANKESHQPQTEGSK